MTYYCRVHSDWEGIDLGKIHDHIREKHQEELSTAKTIPEYFQLLKNMVFSKIYEIPGPNRLSDTQWIARYHGKPPKIGNLMGQNETEKR